MFVSRGGVPLGEIGRHQIRLDLFTFGVFGLFIFWRSQDLAYTLAFLVAVFASILIHELGHALMIEALVKESTVIVIGFGGATFHNYIRQPGKQLFVSLGGPVLGFAAGLLAWGAAVLFVDGHPTWPPWQLGVGATWELSLNFFIWASLLWSILNLVPILPLDGGQALRAFLIVIGVPNRSARRWTRRLTLVLAVLIGGWAVVVAQALLIGLIAVMAIMAMWDEAQREGW